MSFQVVVVGAGATGRATALLLAESGARVALVSRGGRGPSHPNLTLVAADASDVTELSVVAAGATTLFNCAMPAYDRWPADFPPLASSLLATARSTGADYVMLGNAYGYGFVDGPYTEDLPMAHNSIKGGVRAAMWLEALDAYEAGDVRVTEVRASDYLGAGAASLYTIMVEPEVLAGRPAVHPADLDVPHSWTHIGDVARTLAGLSSTERSWGRAWHVPSSAMSVRELTERLTASAGAPPPVLQRMTAQELDLIGETEPIMREVAEMLYMWERPFVLDSTDARRALGIEPTPLDVVVAEIVESHKVTAMIIEVGRDHGRRVCR